MCAIKPSGNMARDCREHFEPAPFTLMLHVIQSVHVCVCECAFMYVFGVSFHLAFVVR